MARILVIGAFCREASPCVVRATRSLPCAIVADRASVERAMLFNTLNCHLVPQASATRRFMTLKGNVVTACHAQGTPEWP
jgi:hypothetical protein